MPLRSVGSGRCGPNASTGCSSWASVISNGYFVNMSITTTGSARIVVSTFRYPCPTTEQRPIPHCSTSIVTTCSAVSSTSTTRWPRSQRVSRERWESSHRPDRAGSLVNTGDHGEVSQPLMSEDNDCPLAATEWSGAAVRSRSQRRGSGDVLPAEIERRDRGIGVLHLLPALGSPAIGVIPSSPATTLNGVRRCPLGRPAWSRQLRQLHHCRG
jgi:hypothetical protein